MDDSSRYLISEPSLLISLLYPPYVRRYFQSYFYIWHAALLSILPKQVDREFKDKSNS